MHCPSCSAELSPRATFCAGCGRRVEDPLVGTLINARYRIDARIAIGGFGAIYRATQVTNDREVAIKIMHRQFAADQQLVARFRREGAALCSLRDAHTVTTYEIDESADGAMYIVMELLDGKNLLELFQASGALPWQRVFAIARSVCSALAEAHALGIVHRDLKPANIFLDRRADGGDLVKVLDFGIAKIMKGSGIDDGSELTAMGQAVGTLEYMAPEQLMGGKCDGRTDIYTLGVVLYEMIAGRRPFGAVGFDLLTVQLTERAPPPSAFAEVPPGVDAVLLRCLEHDPAERFADVGALSQALAEVAALRPTPPRTRPETPYEPAAPGWPGAPPARPRVQVRPETPARNRPETPYQPEPRLFEPGPPARPPTPDPFAEPARRRTPQPDPFAVTRPPPPRPDPFAVTRPPTPDPLAPPARPPTPEPLAPPVRPRTPQVDPFAVTRPPTPDPLAPPARPRTPQPDPFAPPARPRTHARPLTPQTDPFERGGARDVAPRLPPSVETEPFDRVGPRDAAPRVPPSVETEPFDRAGRRDASPRVPTSRETDPFERVGPRDAAPRVPPSVAQPQPQPRPPSPQRLFPQAPQAPHQQPFAQPIPTQPLFLQATPHAQPFSHAPQPHAPAHAPPFSHAPQPHAPAHAPPFSHAPQPHAPAHAQPFSHAPQPHAPAHAPYAQTLAGPPPSFAPAPGESSPLQLPAELPASTIESQPRLTRPLLLLVVFLVIGIAAGAAIAFLL